MSLRIAPASSYATSTTNTSTSKLTSANQSQQSAATRGAPSAPGLPDTIRTSHSTTTSIPSTHPLESRLTRWNTTQSQLRSNLLRRNFGIALPLRMSMEQSLVRKSDSFRPSLLGPASGVHDDILSGRDTSVGWEDIYNGQDGLRGVVDQGGDGSGMGWHEEMERSVGMGKW